MQQTTINRRAYDYASIKASFGGIPFTKISSISWTVDQAKENQYGLGTEPNTVGHGIKEYAGSLEIQMGDIEALRAFSTTGLLVDIPAFDIILTYGNTTALKTHVLVGVEFKKDEMTGAVGDMALKSSLDIIFSSIKFK